MAKAEDAKPDYLGHRKRLRERFLNGGGKALADYEVIELLLCHAQPRRDVKPVAKRLIDRFGSLPAVFAASREELESVAGVKEASVVMLKIVQEAALRMAWQEVLNRPVLSSWKSVIAFCHQAMAYERKEHFRLLFLDAKNMLIREEVQQTGTVNHAPVYPREVVKRALEVGASAIIMVHNHPSGDPTPSQDDIAMTREVAQIGAKLGIALHDHVIIGRRGHASLRSLGLL
ncbi:MAG: DNA repair protein RadC [Rhodospirillaceae bacterium]|nr:DNA repair protein RadC [Rhodospirillaceae bacterium]